MKLTLQSTTRVVELDGVPARIWEGTTESGVPVHAFITRVAVAREEDCGEFERELEEHAPPSPVVAAIPARLIL